MGVTQSVPRGASMQVSADADVGAGSIVSLDAEGLVGSLGIPAASLQDAYEQGDEVLSEATGKLFALQEGTAGLCAVLVNPQVAFANTLFVSSTAPANGNGTASRPFQTIAAALTAAVANTLISISAGTYNEALVIPQLNGLGIVGEGPGVTIIESAGATTLDFTVTAAGIAKFYVADLTLRNTSAVLANRCMTLDGNAVADAATEIFRVLRVRMERTVASAETMLVRRLDQVVMQSIDATRNTDTSQETIIRNCGSLFLDFCAFGVARFGYNSTNPIPAGGRQGYTVAGGSVVLRTTYLEGPVFIGFGPDVGLIGDAVNLAVDGTALSTTAAPVHHPILYFQNQFGNPAVAGSGRIDIRLPATTAAALSVLLMDECRLNPLSGVVAGHWSIRAAAGVLLQPVSIKNAFIPFTNLATGPVAGAFVIGAVGAVNLTVDVRGTFYGAQTIFSVPVAGPTLDRSAWTVSGNITNAGVIVGTTIPYPPGTSYNVDIETPVSAGAPVLTGVSAKTTAQFTATNTSVAAVATNFTLLRV